VDENPILYKNNVDQWQLDIITSEFNSDFMIKIKHFNNVGFKLFNHVNLLPSFILRYRGLSAALCGVESADGGLLADRSNEIDHISAPQHNSFDCSEKILS